MDSDKAIVDKHLYVDNDTIESEGSEGLRGGEVDEAQNRDMDPVDEDLAQEVVMDLRGGSVVNDVSH